MKILSIETSCDETAISIIEAKGGFKNPQFKIVANTLISQINIHKKYGGVFPALAKREHTKNLLPILKTTLKKAVLTSNSKFQISKEKQKKVFKILEREPELAEKLIRFLEENKNIKVDAVAVTQGPGLEPALWTGLNFAKVLALVWNKPFIPVNHMEGHLVASLLKSSEESGKVEKVKFPALGLLLSGGHTELILMSDWMKYKTVGQTRDDAVGEAYDKVARMLGLPYPGGPEVANLSDKFLSNDSNPKYPLPRPMINSDDLDFSFSGLKTAVLYTVKNIPKLTSKIKQEICFEFEEAVIEVLLKKTLKAIKKYKTKTLIIGGGVSANKKIRKIFKDLESNEFNVLIPEIEHSTDNAVMIGIAGYFRFLGRKALDPNKTSQIKANGNLRL